MMLLVVIKNSKPLLPRKKLGVKYQKLLKDIGYSLKLGATFF